MSPQQMQTSFLAERLDEATIMTLQSELTRGLQKRGRTINKVMSQLGLRSAMDVFIQVHPEISAVIWGSVRLLLQVSRAQVSPFLRLR
jgi:hypothetical protein